MNEDDWAVVKLVAGAHAMVHVFELSIPLLVTIWLVEFGVTPAMIGLVVTVGYALFGFGALPAGAFADRIGSQRLIVWCLLGMAAAFFGLSLAPGVVSVALALLVWGAAASLYHPSGLSLVSRQVTTPGIAFAYHGIAGNVGTAVGPLVTILLLGAFEWRAVAAVLAAGSVLVAVYAARVEVEDVGAGTPHAPNGGVGGQADHESGFADFLAASHRLFAGTFLAVFGLLVLYGLYYRGMLTFLPEVIDGLALEPVALGGRRLEAARYLYAGLLLVGVFGQYAGGRLISRLSPEAGLVGAYATLAALALVFIPIGGAGLGAIAAIGVALGFTLFFVQPLQASLIAKHTPHERRGLAYGFTFAGVFGVGAIGGVIAGWILTYFSPTALFAALAAFVTGSATIAALIRLRWRRWGRSRRESEER